MSPALLMVPVLALVLSGCGGSAEVSEHTAGLDTDVDVELEAVEPLGFIEVSVRIGDRDDAELISLAADRSTLDGTGADGSADGLSDVEPIADCSGPAHVLSGAGDTGIIEDGYEIRVDQPAISVAEGGATGFELLVAGAFEIDEPVAAEFVVRTDDAEFRVADGEMILGEVINAGVFSGIDADGVFIDGAFLCG